MPSSLRLPLRQWRALPEAERKAVHRHNLATLMIGSEDMIDEETIAIQAGNAERARINSRPMSAGRHLLDSLERGKPPLGAIWGRADAIARNDLDERIAALRCFDPELRVAIIPDAGHWVAHERPAAFAAALKAMIHNEGGRFRQ
jgi:pimeloyl-ACP methyl ester carboxylesterase